MLQSGSTASQTVQRGRVQADALEIESQAKRRIAYEYDAAQDRGEVASNGQRGKAVPDGNSSPTTENLGFTRKAIHEARQIRDAEVASPGVVRRTPVPLLARLLQLAYARR